MDESLRELGEYIAAALATEVSEATVQHGELTVCVRGLPRGLCH